MIYEYKEDGSTYLSKKYYISSTKVFYEYKHLKECNYHITKRNARFLEIALNDYFSEEDYEHLPYKLRKKIKKAINQGAELLHLYKR